MFKFINLSNKQISIIFGLLLSLALLYISTIKKNIDAEEFALGADTTSLFGKVGDANIHCSDLRDVNLCIESYFKYGNDFPVTLFLGNSQLHAINQFSKHDKTTSMLLHEKLIDNKKFLITFSQPNANLQEHLILFSYLNKKLPIDTLILPLVFDDLRENNIRNEIENIFKEDNETYNLVTSTLMGAKLYKNYLSKNKNLKDIYSKKSYQEKSENFLNTKLENKWSLWSERSGLRVVFFQQLYKFRNFIFNIKPTSIRKMIPGHYQNNKNALLDIIKISKQKKIKILLYIAPIRNDIKIPYNLNEYNEFKLFADSISRKQKIILRNFENIVPSKFWGLKDSTSINKNKEIDFMHFKYDGHKILSNFIFKDLVNLK